MGERYANDAKKLSKELKYEEGMANAYRNFGHIYQFQGKYPQALNNYFEALSLYENLNKKHAAGWIYYHIAKTHFFAKNYEKAIDYVYLALDKFRDRTAEGAMIGNVRDTTMMYGGLGMTYTYMGMIEKANDFFLLNLRFGLKNNFGLSDMMILTFRIGANYLLIGETDSAKVYFD